jgi:hypothetical protein
MEFYMYQAFKERKHSWEPYHDFEFVVTINHFHQPTQVKKRKKISIKIVFLQLCCASIKGCCSIAGMLRNDDKVSRTPPDPLE